MSEKIYVNEEMVETTATRIEQVSTYFSPNLLIGADNKTTITANSASQKAYEDSQKLIELLGQNLEREVENIRSIGVAFLEFDTMMANLIKSGTRIQTISPID